MTESSTQPPSLSTEEKRQVVYASLVRFAPEAGPLRDRAVHRAVLGALIGSSSTNPYRLGHIRGNMTFGSETVSLRTEVVQKGLADLEVKGFVDNTLLRERHAYFITTQGQKEVDKLVVPVVDLFQDVNDKLFRDIDSAISAETAATIFRRFACECFGRFGKHIAQTVIGSLSREGLQSRPDARAAFAAASEGYTLTDEQLENLEVRCQRFLVSAEPCDERLKLYLTQGYYFAQLMGIDGSAFNPLAEDAFRGAEFYLDTNVLVLGFLHAHEDSHEFAEVVALSKRLGITLKTTRATIEEMQRVIKDRVAKISQIAGVVPDELVRRTNDQILQAFWHAFQGNRKLTPEEFFEPFLVPNLQLSERSGVVVEELGVEDMIGTRDTKKIGQCMNEEAQSSRGFGKGQVVLGHDVAHYLLISDRRQTNKKVWFLTRDRSLPLVAKRLDPDTPAFCFPHLGLLQSISPFVSSDSEERSLADIMSSFITDQIRPIHSLFDLSELAIMAEFHADVMATPADQLVLAFDYIKNSTLKGHEYVVGDVPRVSLELRKFLAADKDKQILVLHAERERAITDVQRQNELLRAAEQQVREAIERNQELEEQVAALSSSLSSTQSSVTQLETARKNELRRQHESLVQHRKVQAISWGIGALLLLLVLTKAAYWVTQSFGLPGCLQGGVSAGLRVLAALMLAVPSIRYVGLTKWSETNKALSNTIVIAVAMAIANVVSANTMSNVSDYLGVAAVAAAVVLGVMLNRPKET